jgi:hypothetical protein
VAMRGGGMETAGAVVVMVVGLVLVVVVVGLLAVVVVGLGVVAMAQTAWEEMEVVR